MDSVKMHPEVNGCILTLSLGNPPRPRPRPRWFLSAFEDEDEDEDELLATTVRNRDRKSVV